MRREPTSANQPIKRSVKHSNSMKMRKSSARNSELWVARGSCGAKAPCHRAPFWSDPVGARQLRVKALRRRAPLNSGGLWVACGGSGAKPLPLPRAHIFADRAISLCLQEKPMSSLCYGNSPAEGFLNTKTRTCANTYTQEPYHKPCYVCKQPSNRSLFRHKKLVMQPVCTEGAPESVCVFWKIFIYTCIHMCICKCIYTHKPAIHHTLSYTCTHALIHMQHIHAHTQTRRHAQTRTQDIFTYVTHHKQI